jgi:hypothetical protein
MALIPKRVSSPNRVKFSEDEDARLTSLVGRLGIDDWPRIAAEMRTKNSRQCRERWLHYLSPELNTAPWTHDEEMLIVQKYQELGPKWVVIANYLPHRTDSMVKNRFKRLQRLWHKAKELLSLDYIPMAAAAFVKDPPQVVLAEKQTVDVCEPRVTEPTADESDISLEWPEAWEYLDDIDNF